MMVQTDGRNEKGKADDVRNLSGGERSYTTFCLMLALGHAIECPFRVKDEYDVFLDEISRRVTLDIIQRYVMLPEMRTRQFIFITPNSLSDVVTNPNTQIIYLPKLVNLRAHGLRQTILEVESTDR